MRGAFTAIIVAVLVVAQASLSAPASVSSVDAFYVYSGRVRVGVAHGDYGHFAAITCTSGEGQVSTVLLTRNQWISLLRYYNRAVRSWNTSISDTFQVGGVTEGENSRQTTIVVYLSTTHNITVIAFALRDPVYYKSTIVMLDSEDCTRFSSAARSINYLNGW